MHRLKFKKNSNWDLNNQILAEEKKRYVTQVRVNEKERKRSNERVEHISMRGTQTPNACAYCMWFAHFIRVIHIMIRFDYLALLLYVICYFIARKPVWIARAYNAISKKGKQTEMSDKVPDRIYQLFSRNY